ncbi:NADPH-dependent curcumin reductase CurA [Nocardioides zeae]|uniref:NADPH-dependent curcumin reductase CurA n=1 Tax=Nocardioides zeae TaxID=1457234 RepID=A0ACC6IJS2_9ACTN|nr:NADP-dependent oxidoreductase [Nocardioides zeae]MDR6174672.1 NADPH-dependent curcumin reductase CurA [Nocardioides zeae]MDR6210742.1 NADPH-dependent curcumin reductase CurA [Nocardioides zeae]
MTTSREVRLVARPEGRPTRDLVEVVETEVECGADAVVVRNLAMSVEPYMQGRMSEHVDYATPYALGEPLGGHAVGQVVASTVADLPEGTVVLHEKGWRELSRLRPDEVQARVPDGTDPLALLGALGQTGFTAWVGLSLVAGLQAGETVFITSAAGAVGAVAGQIAKAQGCTVIGSCGGQEKGRVLRGLGFDAVVDHRAGPVRSSLKEALASVGRTHLDVTFDNVGGEQLEAAIRHMGDHGRIALCGAISTYDATSPVPGPRNLLLAIWRRLRLEGFIVGDHETHRSRFDQRMTRWLADGTVVDPRTEVAQGIENAFDGFLRMLDGASTGKSYVRLAD